MDTIAFGYRCQECGQGTVQGQVVPKYRTRIHGLPFTVTDAQIGVCDQCKAEHFSAQETRRWNEMFDETRAPQFLASDDISQLRTSLGLSMEQFALLIGCTRQSVHNWERSDRKRVQSRMADLLLRLVKESEKCAHIDVPSFLVEQAKEIGPAVQLNRQKALAWPALVLKARRGRAPTPRDRGMSLAADTELLDEIALVDATTNKRVGQLVYDFGSASLRIKFSKPVEFDRFDAEVHFGDGSTKIVRSLVVQEDTVILLSRTEQSEEQVDKILIRPPRDADGAKQ